MSKFISRESVLKLSLACLLATVATVTVTSIARAQNEESEEARQAADKAKRRHYPGGKDEQELTVQAVLPVTSRYPMDPKAAAAAGTQKEQPADDSHD